jgi:hypothetical protein
MKNKAANKALRQFTSHLCFWITSRQDPLIDRCRSLAPVDRATFDDLRAQGDHEVLPCLELACRHEDTRMPSRIAVARSVCAQNPPEPIGATRAKESWQLAARPFFRLSSQTAPGAQPRGRLTGVWQTVRPCRHVVHRISLQLCTAWWRGGLSRSRPNRPLPQDLFTPCRNDKDTPVQVHQRDRVPWPRPPSRLIRV